LPGQSVASQCITSFHHISILIDECVRARVYVAGMLRQRPTITMNPCIFGLEGNGWCVFEDRVRRLADVAAVVQQPGTHERRFGNGQTGVRY